MLIFDNDINDEKGLKRIIENYALVNAGNFDVLILRTGRQAIDTGRDIHLWLKRSDESNANLMILLSFIIYAHPDWKKNSIKIFDISKPGEVEKTKVHLQDLIIRGRLPITLKNIEFLEENPEIGIREMINQRSSDAGLVILGFRGDHLKHQGAPLFQGFNNIGTMLFVNSHDEKVIE